MLNSERVNTFLLTIRRNARTLPSSLLLVIVLEVLEIKMTQIRNKVILIYLQMTQSHGKSMDPSHTHTHDKCFSSATGCNINKQNQHMFLYTRKNLTIKFRRQLF